MAFISDLRKRFEALQGKEAGFVAEALQEEKQHILDLNREQLYDGKDSLGKNLSPTYFEDPYFETLEQAIGYSNWKDKITPNPRRTKGVPNLFINGYYYKTIDVKISLQGLHFNSKFDEQNDIKDKYGLNIYGLSDASKLELSKSTNPAVIAKIRSFVKL